MLPMSTSPQAVTSVKQGNVEESGSDGRTTDPIGFEVGYELEHSENERSITCS